MSKPANWDAEVAKVKAEAVAFGIDEGLAEQVAIYQVPVVMIAEKLVDVGLGDEAQDILGAMRQSLDLRLAKYDVGDMLRRLKR